MSEEEREELEQLKRKYPIVSANDYKRMNAEERADYMHFLDLLEKEFYLEHADEDEQ